MYKRHLKSDTRFSPIPDAVNHRNPNSGKNGFSPFDMLLSFLPDGVDIGDVILILLLLLLYLDSKDDEFLIMLLATAMSFFQN